MLSNRDYTALKLSLNDISEFSNNNIHLLVYGLSCGLPSFLVIVLPTLELTAMVRYGRLLACCLNVTSSFNMF